MLNFDNPAAFFLLISPLVIFLMRKSGLLKKISYPVLLSDWNGKTFDYSTPFLKFLIILTKIINSAIFVLTITSLSGPVIRHQEKVYTSRGPSVLFILDVSPSMAAKDIANTTRLEASKTAVKTMISSNPASTFGLVAMANEASIIVPPTSDTAWFLSRLEELSLGQFGDGTALGTGLSTAVYHFATSSAQKKSIVLITDGENNAGSIHPETAARLASKNNIDLYILGIGTNGTVQIEYKDPKTGAVKSGFYESTFSSEPLMKLSQAGNGKYFGIDGTESLSAALREISIRNNKNMEQDFFIRTVDKKLTKNFIYAAIILIIISLFFKKILVRETFRFLSPSRWTSNFIFKTLAFASLVLAYFGISFGKEKVPVQKNGSELAMVFDISYSMTAQDCDGKTTRLENAKNAARNFLSALESSPNLQIPVSIVLAKGDGVLAVPLTEDYEILRNLIDRLSPSLMSAPGTNLAKGVDTAQKSFSPNSARTSNIWVYTDAEETEKGLEDAFENALLYGTKISIIGFGNEAETEIFAGDGKTKVKTALRKNEIEEIITKVNEKSLEKKITFYDTTSPLWASKLFRSVSSNSGKKTVVSYEIQKVSREKEFICLALILFLASIFVSEADFRGIQSKTSITKMSALVLVVLTLFTGCSNIDAKKDILKGTWCFYQHKYEKAAASFLHTAENENIGDFERQYGTFALASTYIAMEENTSALKKMEEIEGTENEDLLYGVYYNTGIIAYKNGNFEEAQSFFKKAISADPSKINARINLELCRKSQIEKETAENEAVMNKINLTENDIDMEKAVFNMVREQESRRWKKDETPANDKLDY